MEYPFSKIAQEAGISLIRKMNSLAKPSTINLGLGQLNDPIPESMQEAARQTIERGKIPYTPNAGLPELRQAIADEQRIRLGYKVSLENILVCAGVQNAIHLTCSTFLNKGDEVLIPEISFSPYRTLPPKFGAKAVEFKLIDGFKLDFADLREKITPKTKMIIVNSPNNPTGRVTNLTELGILAEIVDRNELMLLSDEIYSGIYTGTRPDSPRRFTERAIVVDGLSKREGSGAGLRLAYILAPQEVIERMTPLLQDNLTCAPYLSQVMAIPAYQGKCIDWECYIRDRLGQNRTAMMRGLDAIPGLKTVEPRGAFYCFPNISAYKNERTPTSEAVAMRLLAEGNVLTIPGAAFGKAGDDYLRLSYAGSEESVLNGLDQIGKVFAKWNHKI